MAAMPDHLARKEKMVVLGFKRPSLGLLNKLPRCSVAIDHEESVVSALHRKTLTSTHTKPAGVLFAVFLLVKTSVEEV